MPPPRREDLWSQGKDETVEVNQRALIDKILARYSGEHTKLLQNADDAGAEHVQVRFYTQARLDALEAEKTADKGEGPSRLPDAKKDNIARYVVMNDGIPFRGQDWQRLKKIAEGNPDEEKIGAFGVGFYSLWSVCDDPFVESGGKWMGFYWKDGKDQLLARSGDLPPDSASSHPDPSTTGHPWTSFTMDLREPSPLEGPLDLARFFVTSLTFMRTMKKIDMLVDDVRVLRVSKQVKDKTRVAKKGLKSSSSHGMMSVNAVDATGMIITADVMQWLADTGFLPPALPTPAAVLNKGSKTLASFFSSSIFNRSSPSPAPTPPPPPPPEPVIQPTKVTTLTREVHTYQAEIKVSVSPTFGRELERATKKPPPKTMPASLVFSRQEEDVTVEGASTASRDVGDVFGGLCPPLDGEKSAKVFIGQATSQTTGIGGHLAARFIPTVERESIDLVDRHVSHWNKELLWVGGYLSRLIYELEMQEVQTLWATTSVSDKSTRERLLARALHALRFFTFKPTTPSSVVGQELESAFYGCAIDNKSLPFVSNIGILPINKVKLPDSVLHKFLPDLPTVTPEAMTAASRSIARLQERGLLRNVMFDDVIAQLGQRPLTEKEMIDCLQWWQSVANADGYTQTVRARLIDAAILLQDDGKVVPLSLIQTVVKPQTSSIPTDMPLPTHTLPYTVTKELRGNTIWTIFGWTELTITQYIEFLVRPPMSGVAGVNPETDIRTSPIFAEKVLAMLGRAWQSIAANQQTAVAAELREVECIPTKAGFKKPGEAYFEKNLLFDDLPTIALPKTPTIKGGMEKMLLGIGVRKTVNLQLVFSRLIGGGTWTCQDLMKYLVSVKDTLTDEEMGRLKHTAAFPLEMPLNADGSRPPTVRHKPFQLYEPVDAMRNLGLPVLDWGEGKWRPGSEEARMLFVLGLKRYPPLDVLLGLAAGPAPTNQKALQYLIAQIPTHYINFDPKAFANVAFLPATRPGGDGKQVLAKPGEVFTNWSCSLLGFAVADPSIATTEVAAKLRIPSDPSMDQLVPALMSHITKDIEKARRTFEYMGTQIGHAPGSEYSRLATAAFIPVKTERDVQMFKPSEVYFAKTETNDELYGSAFTFVDFGAQANTFLRLCGVRSEPSVRDIAWLLMKEPERTLKQAGSKERYLQQLRLLAANWANFDAATRKEMKSAAFVLASQHVSTSKATSKKWLSGKSSEPSPEEYEIEWVLCRADEIALIDNPTMVQYFGKHILAGPEEELLEGFYFALGARWITSMVKTESLISHPQSKQSPQAVALRQHVLERLTIFLAEARRKQAEYTIDVLRQEGRFVISEVRGLQVRYTLRHGRQEHAHYETLYATASKTSRNVTLTVSTTSEPDDYDIASSLCAVLLKNPKADDALLLYSILSTPLVALKKRGFKVDRLLNQEREERLRLKAEQEHQRATQRQEEEKRSAAYDDDTQSIRSGTTMAPSIPPSSPSQSSIESGKRSSILDQIAKRKSGNGLMGKLPSFMDSMPGAFNSMRNAEKNGGPSMQNGSSSGGKGGPPNSHTTKEPSSMDNIRRTVQTAINMSKPSKEVSLADQSQTMTDTAESESNWCDKSVQTNLSLAYDGGPGTMKLYIPNDEQDPMAFLRNRLDSCQRFERDILQPLARIFGLNAQIISVFWDHEGPTIAFNRDGALFCNARYYAAWHDEQVRNGQTNEAFVSWYMSLAHELAHNLESAHNSRHEFHFSSIAETYLVKLAELFK